MILPIIYKKVGFKANFISRLNDADFKWDFQRFDLSDDRFDGGLEVLGVV